MKIHKIVFVIALGLLLTAPICSAEWIIDNGISTGGQAITAYDPTASPVAGTYHATQTVTLTATGASAICYTRDDTTPACATPTTCTTGTVYSSALSVTLTDTIKAISCYDDNGSASASNVASHTYILTCSTSSVSNGTVGSYPSCTITCNSGYTLSGSTCVASGGGGGGGGGGTPAAPSAVSSSNVPLSVTTSQAGTLTQSFSDSSSIKVEIPEGSITQTTTFSATQSGLTGGLTPTNTTGAILIGNMVYNVSAVNSSNQSVTSFSDNLTITLTVPDLTEGSDLGVYYYNSTLDKWELIPGAEFNYTTKKVSFSVDHLTRFGVFEIASLPEYIETEAGIIVEDSFWTVGKWVKTADKTTVYFVDNSDERHAYPNQRIWESYFGTDFSFVITISKEELASYPLGRNVPYAPGSLFKISSIPKVYRVGDNRLIQWIASEEKAVELYGANWATLVHDLPDGFFGDYVRGDAIE